ncbi:MAG: type II toxin-antitoxin system RelE/ParE family toxin [Dysgonamonadaceae bacterium]|jgi:proteic killer suppression protein|nr:type II toxin-antitoxin system RelE/ParE family toxin [Dysgonamonadaceae bacterium]
MIVSFEQPYLRDLYETGKSYDKKHRFQPPVIEKYKERIDTLKKAHRIEDLFPITSLNYKVLQGDKQGISSIRVNQKYRIEFTVERSENDILLTVCNIQELSNHYK